MASICDYWKSEEFSTIKEFWDFIKLFVWLITREKSQIYIYVHTHTVIFVLLFIQFFHVIWGGEDKSNLYFRAGLANCYYKGPENKYFRFYRSLSLLQLFSSAAIDNTRTNVHSYVPIKCIYQNRWWPSFGSPNYEVFLVYCSRMLVKIY